MLHVGHLCHGQWDTDKERQVPTTFSVMEEPSTRKSCITQRSILQLLTQLVWTNKRCLWKSPSEGLLQSWDQVIPFLPLLEEAAPVPLYSQAHISWRGRTYGFIFSTVSDTRKKKGKGKALQEKSKSWVGFQKVLNFSSITLSNMF